MRELARSTYQNSLSNYLNFANADYAKEQDRIAQENYLREFEYQKEQDRLAQENWLKEYEMALKKNSNSGSSGSSSKSSSSTANTSNASNWSISGTTQSNAEPVLTQKASDWVNSMRNLEKMRGVKVTEDELKIGIASMLKQGAFTEAEAKAVLKELGY